MIADGGGEEWVVEGKFVGVGVEVDSFYFSFAFCVGHGRR